MTFTRSLCLLGLTALLPGARRIDAAPSVPFPFRSLAGALAAAPVPPVPLRFRPMIPVDVDPLRDAPEPVIVPDDEARLSKARLSGVRLNEVRLNEVRLNEVRLNEVRLKGAGRPPALP
jgi:hypothetical protein